MKSKYRERLATFRLRSWYHSLRYKFLANFDLRNRSVLEIGCHDGLTLDYIEVFRYLGYDIGWEDGLSYVEERVASNVQFLKGGSITHVLQQTCFEPDVLIALETIEHVDQNELDNILAEISLRKIDLIFSVPNEIHLIFFLKSIYKKIFQKDKIDYSFGEFINQVLGRTEQVRRDNHKGFSYKKLSDEIRKKNWKRCLYLWSTNSHRFSISYDFYFQH